VNPSKRAQEFLDKPIEMESLGLLLTDFFFYYALEFPYSTSYISVTEGKVLPKESADWITKKDADRLAIQCIVNSGILISFPLQSRGLTRRRTSEPDMNAATSLNSTDTLRRVFKEGYAYILQLTTSERNTLKGLVAVDSQVCNLLPLPHTC
jgi:Cid1 family poly A polymerase